ncbi:energy transducer TonB [candidate division KSB1 bacterium]|nr:energy transducer TonB [candidate division KSB1 bacterium]
MFQKHPYKTTFVISIIIHLLLLLIYRPITGIANLFPQPVTQDAEIEPLVFEFEEPRELVETPEEARVEKPPDNAQFYSDKNARAQDLIAANDLPSGLSFSEGQTDYKIFAGGGVAGEQMEAPQNEQQQQEDGRENNNSEQSENQYKIENGDLQISQQQQVSPYQRQRFSKDLLYGRKTNRNLGENNFTDDVNWNNQESSAEDAGGISLSTYEWNYAPYLLYLKRRVRDHVYPPAAFYQLGVINGEVILKFTIFKNGSITDPQLITNKGHDSFISTSINAIKASSPFKYLPDDFPEKELEIIWTFVYSIY